MPVISVLGALGVVKEAFVMVLVFGHLVMAVVFFSPPSIGGINSDQKTH